jgi:hypothetical protein
VKRVSKLGCFALYLLNRKKLSLIVNRAILIEKRLMIKNFVIYTGFSGPVRTFTVEGILIIQVSCSSLGPEVLSPGIEDEMAFLDVNYIKKMVLFIKGFNKYF